MNNWVAIVGSVILGLIINECGELSPWLARRIVRWAANVRYPHRAEELEAVLEARPGKLFKLITALGFGCVAIGYRVARRRSERRRRRTWEHSYRRSVIVGDVLCTTGVVALVGALLSTDKSLFAPSPLLVVEAVTAVTVLSSLSLNRVWNIKLLGQGFEEFRSLGRGLFGSIVAMGLGALASGLPGARLWVFIVAPAIALVAFPVRYLLRCVLRRARNEGRALRSVLVVGCTSTAKDLIDRARRAPHLGWRVDAVCTADGRAVGSIEFDGIPVLGRLDQVAEHARRGGYGIVAITADSYWTPRRLRQLTWALEGADIEMVVAPGLMEFAGLRLDSTEVYGMPLIWVTEPSAAGFRRVTKATVDKVGAALLLALLSPVLLFVAIAIMVDTKGPVLFRQRRVGRGGTQFTMLKFRTMVPDGDALLAKHLPSQRGSGMQFSMRHDPRVTHVGRFLRRYSLDELPQLLNVLGGSMSLVGPRPPLPEESASYTDDVRRRLLVKPGLTGLWQVTGRSDLSWDEAIRLDLRYIQDWSLALDLVIMWKTFRAVFGGRDAY